MSRAAGNRALACFGVLALAGAAALLSISFGMHERAATPEPAPTSGIERAVAVADDGFAIDWVYWQGINPDVVGWVRVEGTGVSLPVVQAPADAPTYYLTHDVYGDWNIYGTAYLDAACAEDGLLGSRNAVVSAHHMSDGSMFSELAQYVDAGWAASHATVDLYAPDGLGGTLHERRSVLGTSSVAGWQGAKRTEFLGAGELDAWLDEQTASGVSLSPADGVQRAVTLVTCTTFDFSQNARSVVFAGSLYAATGIA